MTKTMQNIRRYIRQTSGAIAIAFALMAPVVIGAAGMALDYSQAYMVKQRLLQALDAAALAGVASSNDAAEIEQKIMDFFAANYPEEKLGATFDPEVTVNGNEVTVSGTAIYSTTFLRLLDIDELDVEAETVVQREVQGLEVVLVMDNTGSMSTNNNIETLRTAATSFVDILFDNTSNPEYIKVGLVPYANAVRVGKYGLGEKPDGTVYADGEPFVNLPDGMSFTDNHNHSNQDQWFGCVIEHNADGWDPDIDDNDPYPNDVLDNYEGPWDIYDFDVYQCSGPWWDRTCGYNSYYYPAWSCPYAHINPLSSDQDELQDVIDSMVAHGNTLGNIGMVWGYRVLSPEFPFEEGVDWDNDMWKKAVIMMTDGNNTRDSHYSALWRSRNHELTVTDYNERFVETCETMKAQGVTIYTVTFAGGVSENTKDYYRDCADNEDQYEHAPSQEDLITIFEDISRELSNLHIKG